MPFQNDLRELGGGLGQGAGSGPIIKMNAVIAELNAWLYDDTNDLTALLTESYLSKGLTIGFNSMEKSVRAGDGHCIFIFRDLSAPGNWDFAADDEDWRAGIWMILAKTSKGIVTGLEQKCAASGNRLIGEGLIQRIIS